MASFHQLFVPVGTDFDTCIAWGGKANFSSFPSILSFDNSYIQIPSASTWSFDFPPPSHRVFLVHVVRIDSDLSMGDGRGQAAEMNWTGNKTPENDKAFLQYSTYFT